MRKLKKLFQPIKKVVKGFPLTIVSIFIITVVNAFSLENDRFFSILLERINLFIVIFGSATFLIETVWKVNSKKKYLFYFCSAIISFVFTYFSTTGSSVVTNYFFRLIVCYISSFLILGFYFNFKSSKKKFNEYVIRVFSNLFENSIIYGILALGVSIVSSVFVTLMLGYSHYDLVFQLEVLVFGLFYLPTIIYSISNVEKESSKFFQGLVKYILEPLVIIGFIIIYLYIAKIIILWKVPSNEIFRILTLLFILGCPIWTMGNSFKEVNILDKINRRLSYLFIPFIFLQLYSVGIRIFYYGVTEPRYLCVVWILFEIIYIILYFIKKGKIQNIFLVAILLIILSVLGPYINMFRISYVSQYQNLKIYHEKNHYTTLEKKKIYGAYYYLKGRDEEYVKVSIEKLLTKNDIEVIQSFKPCSYRCSKGVYVSSQIKSDHVDVGGYQKLYFIYSNQYYEKTTVEQFENLSFTVRGSNQKLEIDLSSKIQDYIDHIDEFSDYLEKNHEIKLNSKQKIIIQRLSFRYLEEEQSISRYSISAYLLEK